MNGKKFVIFKYSLSNIVYGALGLEEDDLRPCIFWMTPFWGVLKQEVPEYAKTYQKLPQGCNTALMYENEFNLQYHLVSLTLLVKEPTIH